MLGLSFRGSLFLVAVLALLLVHEILQVLVAFFPELDPGLLCHFGLLFLVFFHFLPGILDLRLNCLQFGLLNRMLLLQLPGLERHFIVGRLD